MKPKHSELSYDLINNLHNTILEGFYPTWEDLYAEVIIPDYPNFRLTVWGEQKEGKDDFFSVSLCQGYGDYNKELFTAYAPQDDGYKAVLCCADKVLAHFERSLQEPVQPLHTGGVYKGYTKEIMQPLLDALNNDDFELAAKLTPAKYRLCGYQEFKEDFLYTQYGHGWAGQFADTLISAGRYPVFADKYLYHEADEQWTNRLKDFQGLYVYLAGKCVADSENRRPEHYPYDNTVWESPYCHAIAENILDNNSSVQLLPPFKAEPVHFIDFEGHPCTTYKIVDTSLPERMKHRPSDLRKQSYGIHKTKDLSDPARKLYDVFVWEYVYSEPGWRSANMSLNSLSQRKEYSSDGLDELVVKGFVQRSDCEGIVYQLPPQDRLALFYTDQVNSVDRNGLKWEEEIKKCKMEVSQKQPLADKILDASRRVVTAQPGDLGSKSRYITQPEL